MQGCIRKVSIYSTGNTYLIFMLFHCMKLQFYFNHQESTKNTEKLYWDLPIICINLIFVPQLNPDRATKRRKPQEMSSLNQPFSPTEFNFNKTKPDEILMTLKPVQKSASPSNGVCHDHDHDGEHIILINVSPLEYGHILLVPSLTSNQPQRITFSGLKLAVEMLMLSRSW